MRAIWPLAFIVYCQTASATCGSELQKFELGMLNGLLRQGAANVLLVPPAVNDLMATIAVAASGSGRDEIVRALGQPSLHASNELLLEGKRNMNMQLPGLTMSLQSALFVDSNFPLEPAFLAEMGRLDVTPGQVPMRDDPDAAAAVMNGWARDATRGTIDRIIEPDQASKLVSVLASAFYFKGTWKYRFDPAETRPGSFTTETGEVLNVPMMSQVVPRLSFLQRDDYSIARLPYAGDRVALYLVLPVKDWVKRSGVITAAEALSRALAMNEPARFAAESHELEDKDLELPRFKLKYENKELKDVLMGLGVRGIFGPGNLMAMSGDPRLYVSYVRLDSVLEMNEEGSEAAGVASAGMALESTASLPLSYDRPFGVILRDEKTGAHLLTGVIGRP